MATSPLTWLALVLLGVVVGAFGTLIGAGGGFVLVPVLLLLYPQESPKTIATISLAVVFINALSGTIAYARLGRIDYRTGLLFSAAVTPGAIVGALATSLVRRGLFDVLFGVVLILLALYLLRFGRPTEGHTIPRSVNLKLGIVISFGVGLVSSFLGIGGGIIHVPLMIQVLGYPAHIATATSHFILAITAFVGTVTHIASGEFTEGWRRSIALGIGVLGGAQIGAALSQRVKSRWIVRSLAGGLLLVGLRVIFQAVR